MSELADEIIRLDAAASRAFQAAAEEIRNDRDKAKRLIRLGWQAMSSANAARAQFNQMLKEQTP